MDATRNDTETQAPALDADQRAEIEERLLEERDRALEDLNTAVEEESQPQAASSGDLSKYPSHPADAASHADEADTDFRLANRNTDRLNRIDAALNRLREHPETFGRCEIDGEPIAVERLRLIPWTTRCADHASG